jgi:hypothetical protein
MALNKKQHYRGNAFGNKDLTNAKSLQLTEDATAADKAVRKSQAETISADAVQEKLVSNSAHATVDTAFTSQSLVSFLGAKQDNMSIHASSSALLSIVNGTEIKVSQLLINEPFIDEVSATLADYLVANPSNGLEKGDVLFLTSATTNQERSWMHKGTSNGDATDYIKLVTDYNQASIRAMLSAGDTYIGFDQGSGQISLNRGINAGQLGAQTLPADATQFSVVSGSTVETLLIALENLIVQVDTSANNGSATTNTRLDTLSGVTGNSLETFNGSTFSSNQNVKQILQQSEAKHENADADRSAIRGEVATTEATLASSVLTEKNRALGAEASEASTRQFADNVLQANINSTVSAISSEASTRYSADVTMSDRLDVVENDSSVVGSIEHAKADALAYTDNKVALEATARQEQDAVLNLKINNLAEGDITFVGELLADGTISVRSERIASGDTRNGQALVGIDLAAGETFIAKVNLSLTYTDSSVVDYEAGDKIMLIDDVASGNLVEAKVNAVPANVTGLSLINIGSSTIEIDGSGHIRVIADSITRNELAPEVEADIDDKRSLTADNAMTSNADTHIVTDTTTGAAQNMYYKRTSNTSDALTGTKRTQLAELYVGSNGSANPLAPNFAHTGTWSTHYTGTSTDMSMAVGGGNFEANVVNPNSAVFATGVYALAQSQQLGINSAVTGVAQNAGISNIGITGFGKAGGIGKDRGGVFALSDLEFLSYAGYRAVTPVSYPDVALLADAGTSATGKALVAIGDSIFEGGTVTVPSATTDVTAVNLGDIKAKEFKSTENISAESFVTINHNLNSEFIIPALWLDGELVTSNFDVEMTSANSMTIHNDLAQAVTGLKVLIMKLSI